MNSKKIFADINDEQSGRLKGQQPFSHYAKNARLEELPEINQVITIRTWAYKAQVTSDQVY
jgi:hypothetical protein